MMIFMEIQRTEGNPLGTERIAKLMVRYAVPSIISIVVNSIYNMVDQVFIGQGVGYLGNAGTNIVMPMATIVMALTAMVGAGTATYISLCLGRNEPEDASRGAANAMTLIVLLGVLSAVVFELFMELLCRFFGATDNVLPYAMDYGRIVAAGFPFFAVSCAFGDIIRADGRPRESMIGLLIGCITNIILDPLFIFGCHWGVRGAALATILGQMLSAVFFLWRCMRFTTLKVRRSYFMLRWKTVRKVVILGISNFITQISSVVVMTVMNNLMTFYGAASEYGADIPLAVLGIVVKISQLSTGVVLGIATGVQTIIGYNYGSGQYRRVKKTFQYAMIVSVSFMTLTRIVLWIFPEEIIGLFGQESDLYVEFAVKCFDIFLLAIPLACVCAVTSTLFQATGKAALAAFLSLTRQILYFVPAMILLSAVMGLDGLLWGAAVSDTMAFVTALILLAVFWKKIFREPAEA